MKTFDLYGSPDLDAEELSAVVSTALGADFIEHDSSFRGRYFLADGAPRLEVQPNQVPGDDGEFEAMESEFAEFRTLLYVYGTDRPDEVRDRLAGITGLAFLRRVSST
ncbi:MAG: hypothetical protein ACM30G_16415 [Micromonosporaceae bacterium]